MVRDVDEAGRAWCRSSKLYRWSHAWSAKQLGQILRAYLPPAAGLPANTEVGYLKDIAVTERTPEGRAKRLVVTTDRGEFVVQGDRIRSALKRDLEGNALRSIFFELKTERDKQGRLVRVTATGAGWGHGIGMCQVGAIGRSTAGQRYDEILSAYYPGTRLARRWH
jgi:stage II sporulation protein D